MSSGVTLSSATRSNLLSLQDTAALTSTTQSRLSTGKKVNSAIDNASNYFTAAGLSSRSSALSTLLDGISNGIQTIQAASKGIDGILKLTSQLKSTAQQALASSNAFTSKAVSTATLSGAVSGNILSSGGTVATAQSALGSSSTAAAATATGSAAYVDGRASVVGTGATFPLSAANASFSVNGTTIALANGDTETDVIGKINAQSATTGVTAADNSGQITLTGKSDGSQITLANTTGTGLASGATTNGAGSASQSVTINGTQINYATGSTQAQVLAAINAQTSTTGVTATNSSGSIVLTGAADGSSFTVKGSNTLAGFTTTEATKTGTFHPTGSTLASAIGFKQGDTFSVNNLAVTVGAGDTLDSLAAKVSTATGGDVTAAFDATNRKFVLTAKTGDTAINLANGSTATGLASNLGFSTTHYDAGLGTTGALNSLSGKNLTVKVGTGANATQTTISFGTGSSQVNTLDELNAALSSANAQASIDATTGKLSITTTNEAGAEDLNLSGTASSSVFGTTSSSAVIGGDGNTSRNKLVTDFNNLLTQIDQLSADSGFNGVNLLSGDTVKVIFNEKNTSSVSIKGVATDSSTLGLASLGNTDFQDATKINEVLKNVSSANSTLNSLSATFGTNLSVVQNRQDFSKALINVLDTGASNLTDADLNEEAANSQALTTRQSLGISALSLSNQAQQGILQLLR